VAVEEKEAEEAEEVEEGVVVETDDAVARAERESTCLFADIIEVEVEVCPGPGPAVVDVVEGVAMPFLIPMVAVAVPFPCPCLLRIGDTELLAWLRYRGDCCSV
jgi:hypothetical protein